MLNLEKIKSQLIQQELLVELFDSLPSTNDYLKNKKYQNSAVCLAEQQTQGRGRLGREWYSPPGQNIYLSYFYRFQKKIEELAGLSLVVTLAIVKALKICGIQNNLFSKWPNDVVWEGKKLSGSLIEVQAGSSQIQDVIIGIGLNVNMTQDEEKISQAWTSMQKILGTNQDRNKICAAVINELTHYLQTFNQQGFRVFVEEWIKTDCLTGQTICIQNLDKKVTGKVMGVNEQGCLLLRMSNNEIQAFSAGEATIVKV